MNTLYDVYMVLIFLCSAIWAGNLHSYLILRKKYPKEKLLIKYWFQFYKYFEKVTIILFCATIVLLLPLLFYPSYAFKSILIGSISFFLLLMIGLVTRRD